MDENSDVYKHKEAVKEYLRQQCLNASEAVIDDIDNKEGFFLFLLSRLLKRDGLQNFIQDGELFWEALKDTVTYTGFYNLTKAVTGAEIVKIVPEAPALIGIELVNLPPSWLFFYGDNNGNTYVSKNIFGEDVPYIAAGAGEELTLEFFFSTFLTGFLPAGVVLNSITITTD